MALRISTELRNWLAESMGQGVRDGVLRIFSGAQPDSADDAETGTLLVTLTLSGQPFVPDTWDGGLQFGDPGGGAVEKLPGQTWSGVAVATGTAGWFRFYDTSMVTGEDAAKEAVRFDGNISTGGAQLNMSSAAITVGQIVVVDRFQVSIPVSF